MNPISRACLFSFAAFAPLAVAQSLGCQDLGGVLPIQQQLLATSVFSGSNAVRLDAASGLLLEQAVGTLTPVSQVAIASATKTLSAAVLMSLVDSGHVQLDDFVGQYLPEWNSGAKATITLRMCFAHTSGMATGSALISDDTITLRQAALQLASLPLQSAPGSTFAYGGVSMHVAGAVCEVATGQTWATLFSQRVTAPLGMTATDFGAFGPTQNPRIAGGAQSTLRDYARFVAMLRNRGTWNGTQVLSAQSVDTMLTAQTVGIPVANSPHPYGAPYGIGIWIDRRDAQGRTLLASGVGAFGFAGWIDRVHDVSGTFAVRYLNQITYPYFERIYGEVDAAVLPAGWTCLGVATPACTSPVWMNGTRVAKSGTTDAAVRIDRAPAGLPGALLLGDPLPSGLPVADMTAFLGPQLTVVAALLADGTGKASLPVSLAGVPAGSFVGLQTVWLSPSGCALLGLQASHAVRLDVLP